MFGKIGTVLASHARNQSDLLGHRFLSLEPAAQAQCPHVTKIEPVLTVLLGHRLGGRSTPRSKETWIRWRAMAGGREPVPAHLSLSSRAERCHRAGRSIDAGGKALQVRRCAILCCRKNATVTFACRDPSRLHQQMLNEEPALHGYSRNEPILI